MSNKELLVITGPSGSGKTTLLNSLVNDYGFSKIITHTTRSPRFNEIDGIDYHFETDRSFEDREYIERVNYSGNKYGSSINEIYRLWEINEKLVIILDTVGAISYHNYFSKHENLNDKLKIVFLSVDKDVLIKRIKDRGDSPEKIKERINSEDFSRDLEIPEQLSDIGVILKNDNFSELLDSIKYNKII